MIYTLKQIPERHNLYDKKEKESAMNKSGRMNHERIRIRNNNW